MVNGTEYLKMLVGWIGKMFEAEKINGYCDLNDSQAETFKAFWYNFLNGWETAIIVPCQVRYVQDEDYPYIRFDFTINGRKSWLHVLDSETWY